MTKAPPTRRRVPPRKPRGEPFKLSIKMEVPHSLQQGAKKMGAMLHDAISPTIAGAAPITMSTARHVDRKNLGSRVLVGLSLAGVSLVLVYFGVTWFALEALVLVSVGVVEFCGLAARKGLAPSRGIAILGALVVVSAYAWAQEKYLGNILALTLISTMIFFMFRRAPEGGLIEPHFMDGVATMFSYMYVGWFFGFALLLRRLEGTVVMGGLHLDAGAAYMYLLIVATALSDIGCYAVGKAFGRTPLAPRISPGKTVEGSAGGLLACVLASMGTGHLIGMLPHQSLVCGLVVGIFAQLGDLWESSMKRDVGVKDSGRLLGGHGGVLDRFDSYFFAAPVAYLVIVWFMYW